MRWLHSRNFLLSLFITVSLIVLVYFTPIAFAKNTSTSNSDQTTAIDRLTEISKQLQEPGLRGQHPKGHGTISIGFREAA